MAIKLKFKKNHLTRIIGLLASLIVFFTWLSYFKGKFDKKSVSKLAPIHECAVELSINRAQLDITTPRFADVIRVYTTKPTKGEDLCVLVVLHMEKIENHEELKKIELTLHLQGSSRFLSWNRDSIMPSQMLMGRISNVKQSSNDSDPRLTADVGFYSNYQKKGQSMNRDR